MTTIAKYAERTRLVRTPLTVCWSRINPLLPWLCLRDRVLVRPVCVHSGPFRRLTRLRDRSVLHFDQAAKHLSI